MLSEILGLGFICVRLQFLNTIHLFMDSVAILKIMDKFMDKHSPPFYGVEIDASTAAAIATPTTLPTTAHLISEKSTECRSLCVSKSVNTTALNKSGPGMNDGLINMRSGAPTNPSPNPMEP